MFVSEDTRVTRKFGMRVAVKSGADVFSDVVSLQLAQACPGSDVHCRLLLR
jgi:hypothetical protein